MSEGRSAYRILEIVASGGYGTVCIAWAPHIGQNVALKLLKDPFLTNQRVLARARDEARFLKHIHHPAIVEVYSLEEFGERPVVVMEWVRGVSLQQLTETYATVVPTAFVLECARVTADALHTAFHTRCGPDDAQLGLVHRDLKPDNLLVGITGAVKLVDFGTAKGKFEDREADTVSMVLGTRGFNAPERLDGGDDVPAVDVYALGCTLYELLGGRESFSSMSQGKHTRNLDAALLGLPLPGLGAEAKQAVRDLLLGMCAYDPDSRPTTEEVVNRLTALQRDHGLDPELERVGRDLVAPLYESRSWTPPPEHAAWDKIAFIEQDGLAPLAGGMIPPAVTHSGQVDRWVSWLLAQPSWHTPPGRLARVLDGCRDWNDAPLVERLESAAVSRWRFWANRPAPAEIIAILDAILGRCSPALLAQVKLLVDSSEPEIAHRAQAVLDDEAEQSLEDSPTEEVASTGMGSRPPPG